MNGPNTARRRPELRKLSEQGVWHGYQKSLAFSQCETRRSSKALTCKAQQAQQCEIHHLCAGEHHHESHSQFPRREGQRRSGSKEVMRRPPATISRATAAIKFVVCLASVAVNPKCYIRQHITSVIYEKSRSGRFRISCPFARHPTKPEHEYLYINTVARYELGTLMGDDHDAVSPRPTRSL